jgi:hypothetical protein
MASSTIMIETTYLWWQFSTAVFLSIRDLLFEPSPTKLALFSKIGVNQ